ncbi:4Fe-4S binding protein [Collinsella sp. An2]|uniref:4Fe-4S binding protein n=1 Tax=Collinsella sp. An2 TaxID=1965585 RepID=UPI000B387FDA|nr:4Fe-4S binding protein [Collinsella sp. An2]
MEEAPSDGPLNITAQDCINLLRHIRDASFATVDETGAPQIRIIDVMLAEPGAVIFCTARGKNFYRQLIEDGRVAVTGLTRDFKMVRFQGRARRLPDAEQHAWIDKIFDNNPSMNNVYPGDARYVLEAFALGNGEIELFDLGVSPIDRHSFTLGDAVPAPRGFQITDACIGCGTCQRVCPQRCVVEAEPGSTDASSAPYRIDQDHCLHCGLCAENCPVHAIERRDA